MVRVTGEFMAKFEEPVQSGCVELIRDHREAVTNALIATGWHMNDHIELEQAICVHATNGMAFALLSSLILGFTCL